MRKCNLVGAIALAATLLATTGMVRAFDDGKYPDLSGAWERTGGAAPRFDTSKPRGLTQEPPLTPEYMSSLQGQPGRPGGRRAGRSHRLQVPALGHAGHDERLRADPDRHPARDHLHADRRRQQLVSTNLHRRAQLPAGRRAGLHGLFHRKMDRYHRQRPLRHARGRDPRLQRAAGLRQYRPDAASRQSERHQGAHLSGQERSQQPARPDHGRGPRADPAVDAC